MTTFLGTPNQQQSQNHKLSSITSKRVQKGMHQPIPSSRMIFTMIHFKDHFGQSLKHKDSMMLLTLIMTLMMVISMTKNYSKRNNSLSTLYWLLSFRQKKGELVKEFEGDARSIISKLHYYHTMSNVAQHEVVTLTTYITNLSLTDSRKGTTGQFFSHFKEKLRLLDSLVPDTYKLPETVRITFLQRAVQ